MKVDDEILLLKLMPFLSLVGGESFFALFFVLDTFGVEWFKE
jgi:hypothetical protein